MANTPPLTPTRDGDDNDDDDDAIDLVQSVIEFEWKIGVNKTSKNPYSLNHLAMAEIY